MKRRKIIYWVGGFLLFLLITAGIIIFRTIGRTLVQVNIHQNKEAIYHSAFAEPPQFAIWLENVKTHKLQNVFVTHRAGIGDWEGKANVPVALPRWFELFKAKAQSRNLLNKKDDESVSAITGATPKEDFFSIRAEVKPGSEWICWVEMNLAGDFNEAFPEQNIENLEIDEFSNGQPALLYCADFVAKEGLKFEFILAGQSIWKNGETRIEDVNEGVTTAKEIFDKMGIEVIRPTPKLIEKK